MRGSHGSQEEGNGALHVVAEVWLDGGHWPLGVAHSVPSFKPVPCVPTEDPEFAQWEGVSPLLTATALRASLLDFIQPSLSQALGRNDEQHR